MSEFETALNLVHDVLVRMKETGNLNVKASSASLSRLVATQPGPRAPSLQSPPPPAVAASDKESAISALRSRALGCQKCPHLVKSRTQVVFGVGNLDAEIMFVGEAPGEDEDLTGEPFVGKAGELLTKIIERWVSRGTRSI